MLLWSVIFFACDGITASRPQDVGDRPGLGACLYFSAVTFTTLGYGDFQPRPGGFRLLAGAEAVAGAALMALFIVGLARKYTR